MIYNIKDYGAVGDGRTLNTQVIQNTIDECAKNGGGTVYVSDGVYMTGSITLKSNICLHIQANATLLGSPDCSDYPEKTGLKHVISENLPSCVGCKVRTSVISKAVCRRECACAICCDFCCI